MRKKTLVRMAIAAGFIGLVGMSCQSEEEDAAAATAIPAAAPPPPQAPPPPDPDPTIPAEPANFASRTSGVAPLAVFFDAVSTSSPAFDSGVIQPADGDYGSFHYSWHFGDLNSGNWSTDGRSRNADTGFTAAHVYETPGVYTAHLTVIDAQGDTHAYSQEITVTAFSGTTYYISSSGNDTNNGLSEGSPWQTVGKVFQSLASNRRYLFKRGDTFPVSTWNALNVAGPGIIGAYGSGAKPVWSHSGGTPIVMHSPDWRIMDLQITATPGTSECGVGNAYNVPCVNYLLLRVDISNFRINFIPLVNSDAAIHQQIFLAECALLTPTEYGAMMDGRRLAVMGCTMGPIAAMQHVLRSGMMDKGVISHSRLFTDNGHHCIKLHSTTHGSSLPVTRFVRIADNHLSGGVWTVAMGPQNSLYDERVTQVVVERNLFDTRASTQVGLKIYGQDVTVRNNVFVGTGVQWYAGASVEDGGAVPAAARVRFCNNTFYKGDSGTGFVGINVSNQVSDITIQNNLASAPLVSGEVVFSGSCSGLVANSNLVTDYAGFVDADNGDFTLTTSSPARNDGLTIVGLIDDFTGFVTRPLGEATDLGAFERD